MLGGLNALGVDYADMVLLHGPNLAANSTGECTQRVCDFNRAQWRALVDLRRQGRVRSIGVSNYCPSCLHCLFAGAANSTDGAAAEVGGLRRFAC